LGGVNGWKSERRAVYPSERVVETEILAVKRKETLPHHKFHKLSEAGFAEYCLKQDLQNYRMNRIGKRFKQNKHFKALKPAPPQITRITQMKYPRIIKALLFFNALMIPLRPFGFAQGSQAQGKLCVFSIDLVVPVIPVGLVAPSSSCFIVSCFSVSTFFFNFTINERTAK
jgi:hypothetical protein